MEVGKYTVQSIEKTLKYYKEKVKTLKLNNKSKLKKLQTSWQREKRVLNNKLKSLQRENDQLTKTNILLSRKLKYAQEVKEYSDEDSGVSSDISSDIEHQNDAQNGKIVIHKIFDYGSKLKKNNFDFEDNEIKNVTNKHTSRLNKWKKNIDMLLNGPDEMDSKSLLMKYSEYKELISEQQSKMDGISNYISDLITQKRKLKQFVEKYENEISEKENLYRDSFMEYNGIKDRRNDFYQSLLESVDELNEIIDDENEMNEKKCGFCNEYNRVKQELDQCKQEMKHCSFLIKQYQKFDKINDEKINNIQKYFKTEWILFEKEWCKWDYKSIICWIKYLIAENKLILSKCINLNEIEIKIKNNKINGNWFELIDDKNDLNLIGFININDQQQIYDKIKELILKYPNNNQDCQGTETQIEGKPNNELIPIKFLCPITKNIMMEPVHFVIDNYNYEKSAISNYFRKYKKSPITQEKCDDDEFILVPNRKLAKQIQTFLYLNPEITVKLDTCA